MIGRAKWLQRFWDRASPSPNGCWEWKGARLPSGYGRLGGGTRAVTPPQRAHRVAFMLHWGVTLPSWLMVLHECDNPPCCNPDHLFLGTHADNVADMVSKGRQGTHDHYGEKNPKAKLTREQVEEVKRRLAAGETQVAVARSLGISRGNIWWINKDKTWQPARGA